MPDPNERRAKTVRLTARGEAVVTTGIELAAAYEARLADSSVSAR